MNNIKTPLSKSLGNIEANLLGLMHSALDIEDPRLHQFASWLNSPEFINAPRSNKTANHLAKLQLAKPLKFHNFSGDLANNFCGFGLKSVQPISKSDDIIKMSTQMGLISNILVDDQHTQGDDELLKEILGHTENVSQTFFPADTVNQNRLNQHLLLTQ